MLMFAFLESYIYTIHYMLKYVAQFQKHAIDFW